MNQPIKWDDSLEEYTRAAIRYWCNEMAVRGERVKDLEQDAVIDGLVKTRKGIVKHKSLLWRIARNIVIDSIRRTGGQVVQVDVLEVDEWVPCLGAGTNTKIMVVELKKSYPELVALAYARANGMGWQEIADAVGVNSTTLRTRYKRLKERCVKELGGEVDDILRGIRNHE